jgi:hypothetical protein
MANNAEAKAIIKSYGGWANFCLSYGYKPYNYDENEEAKDLLFQLAAENKAQKEEEQTQMKKKQKN